MKARGSRKSAIVRSNVVQAGKSVKSKIGGATHSYSSRPPGARVGNVIEVTIGADVIIIDGKDGSKIAAKVADVFKGAVVMKQQEDNLIALLDQGKVDEFRRRLNASKLERRKQMFSRVISGE